METEYPPGVQAMLADAAAHGISVEVRARPHADSLEEAAAIQGLTPRDIAKSLVVKHPDGSYLFAVVPGDLSIAWPKLRKLIGVNRLSLPDAAAAHEATGYERGTITPIGCSQPWPIIVDRLLAGRRVAMGAGGHGFSAFIEIDDLVDHYGAQLADITPDPTNGAP